MKIESSFQVLFLKSLQIKLLTSGEYKREDFSMCTHSAFYSLNTTLRTSAASPPGWWLPSLTRAHLPQDLTQAVRPVGGEPVA